MRDWLRLEGLCLYATEQAYMDRARHGWHAEDDECVPFSPSQSEVEHTSEQNCVKDSRDAAVCLQALREKCRGRDEAA